MVGDTTEVIHLIGLLHPQLLGLSTKKYLQEIRHNRKQDSKFNRKARKTGFLSSPFVTLYLSPVNQLNPILLCQNEII